MGRTISIKRLKGAVVFLLLILGMFSFTSYSETKDSNLGNSKEKKWVELATIEKNSEDLWRCWPFNYDITYSRFITCDSIYLVKDIPTDDGLVIKKHSKDKIEEIGRFPCDISRVRGTRVLVDGGEIYFLYFTYSNINIWKYTPDNKWRRIYSKNLIDIDNFIENRFNIQLLPNKELYLSSCVMNILGQKKVIVRKYANSPGKWDEIAEISEGQISRYNYYMGTKYEKGLKYVTVESNGIPYIAYTKMVYDKNKNKYLVKLIIKEGKLGGRTWTIEDEDFTIDYYILTNEDEDFTIDYCILTKNNELYIEYTRKNPEKKHDFEMVLKKIKGDSIVDVCHLISDESVYDRLYMSIYNNVEVMNNGDIYLFNVLELVKFHNGSSDIIYKVADDEYIEAMRVYNERPYILVYKDKERKYILKYLSKD